MIKNLVKTRLPTGDGEFSLYLYLEGGKEHLALVKGEVEGRVEVPVRVHSECLTGDVFGSRRCDCGDQLKHSLSYLGRQDVGILIYLRQEGRGIGLVKKMEAYNLQDTGLDTVEANLQLGHQPDERDYGIAARILEDLGIHSIRLITNNPHKVEALAEKGIEVVARIPIEVGHHAENLGYLKSKAARMAHLLKFKEQLPMEKELEFMNGLMAQLRLEQHSERDRPFVTLAYAQSLDACIAQSEGQPLSMSSQPSLRLTHHLRASHEALLVGVGTILSDNPQLNVRYCDGPNPRPVVLDSHLRIPLDARILDPSRELRPLILCSSLADPQRKTAVLAQGAEVIAVSPTDDGFVDAQAALKVLAASGIRSVMVEGGAKVITTFLRKGLADYAVLTIVPKLLGGFRAIENGAGVGHALAGLRDPHFQPLGSDLIAFGPLCYGD